MSKLPLVSIGLPTYNRPEGLHRMLKCITDQTYTNLEIIISNDCSPYEETEEIIKEFMKGDKRIQYYRQEKNLGAFLNHDFVLQKATGEFYVWACDDDEWASTFIEECLKAFDGNTLLVFTSSQTHLRQQGNFYKNIMPKLSKDKSKFENLIELYQNFVPSIIHGIHRTNSVRDIIEPNKLFDLIGFYWLTKLILSGDIVIVEKLLFTVGVEEYEYVKKPVEVQENRTFVYYTCLVAVLKQIIDGSFCPTEKFRLYQIVLIMFCQLYLWHEAEHAGKTLKNKIKYISVGLLLFFMKPALKHFQMIICRAFFFPFKLLYWTILSVNKQLKREKVSQFEKKQEKR